MRKGFEVAFLMVMVVMLSACLNMNKKIKEDVNVMQAKVDSTEKGIKRLDAQNAELREIVAGEQKRGEYLQRQITEMVNKLQADINTVESRISSQGAVRRPTSGGTQAVSSGTGEKFVSDKMATPPSINDVQLALRNAGFYDGAVDGKPGPKSREGVKEFQRSNGLTADGVVGERTWLKLKKYL
jgi:murein L,D-transpeptidase YcbB/YkuD